MMKKLFKIFLLPAILFTATSCLDKYPDNMLQDKDALQTVVDAEMHINGIYASFKNGALYSGNLVVATDIQADQMTAVEGNGNQYGNFWNWNIKADDSDIAGVYATLYEVIGNCNYFLEYKHRAEENAFTAEDIATMQVLTGEAHFARALAYYELVRRFCETYDAARADEQLGVMLSTKYSSTAPAKRSSLKESFDQIFADLEIASENIGFDESNTVHFTVGTVHALYARLYLEMKDWDKCIEHTTEIIDNPVYEMADMKGMVAENYPILRYMWTNDASYELIWKVGMTATSTGGAIGTTYLNFNYVTYTPNYVPSQWALDLYDGDDGRRSFYFQSLPTSYEHGLVWPLLVKYRGNESFMQYGILHTHMAKVFRVGEMLLIRAEAYANQGKYSLAADDITTLRSARYSNYGGSTNVSAENWFEIINNERTRELFAEGFRLNDLKRWGLGFERESQQSSAAPNDRLKIEAGDYRFVWPIPTHEMMAPGSQMIQNPGY